MLFYLTLIFTCQLVGELIVAATGIPIPGPVIGMVLLFAGLMIRGKLPEELASIGDTLLGNLSLLFVPAGVGIIQHIGLIKKDLLPISVAVIASTAITIAITGALMAFLARKENPDKSESQK